MSTPIAKYTWLVDTLRRAGRLTLAEISRRWKEADLNNGANMNRRTFYNYRQAILDVFGINIKYDSFTHEYYIDREEDNEARKNSLQFTDFLLNSAAMSGMLSDARGIADRIFLEQVPSARQNLSPMIEAIKTSRRVSFSYHPYTRSRPTDGIILEPYLLKLFRQRWYVAGLNVTEGKLKTYALDRVSDAAILDAPFVMPPDFDPKEYFRYSFGIVVDSSRPRSVTIRTNPRQAKYLRALPLHSSQQEMVHEKYSIFTYNLLLTPDFLRELMSLGPEVTILAPKELRVMLCNRLRETLALYD